MRHLGFTHDLLVCKGLCNSSFLICHSQHGAHSLCHGLIPAPLQTFISFLDILPWLWNFQNARVSTTIALFLNPWDLFRNSAPDSWYQVSNYHDDSYIPKTSTASVAVPLLVPGMVFQSDKLQLLSMTLLHAFKTSIILETYLLANLGASSRYSFGIL